jgi:hypothetical protein
MVDLKKNTKTYSNIVYNKSESKYSTPSLICLQCKNTIFKHRTAVTSSRLSAVIPY